MKKSAEKSSPKFKIWHILTGLVVWSAIAYLAVFEIFETPRHEDPESIAQTQIETLNPDLSQPDNEVDIAALQNEVRTTDVPISKPMDLSTSWMESASLAGGWYVQVGSYKSTVEAEVERLKYARLDVSVHTQASEDNLTHLFIGPYENEDQVLRVQDRIKTELGVRQSALRQIHAPQIAEIQSEIEQSVIEQTGSEIISEPVAQPVPDSQSEEETQVAADVQITSEIQPVSEVESSSESIQPVAEIEPVVEVESTASVDPLPARVSIAEILPASGGTWYIQVGAFKDIENARKMGDEVRDKGLPLKIERADNNFVRVLVGPFATRDSATEVQSNVAKVLSLRNVIVRQIKG